MKKFAILCGCLVASGYCRAQWAVIDAANLSQSITNYAALVQQISRQGTEINNQVLQIAQMTEELNRLGSMASVTAVIGFPQLQIDIGTPTSLQTWNANLSGVTGAGLFGDTRDGVFTLVSGTYVDLTGNTVSRDPSLYLPAQAITAAVDNFKTVQNADYARIVALRQGIAQTSAALQAATTDAQEKKLSAVLDAQYGELASLDSEVMLSGIEIQAKASEATAMSAAQGQADTESRTQNEVEEAQAITNTFKPSYASILQYVSEQPYQP